MAFKQESNSILYLFIFPECIFQKRSLPWLLCGEQSGKEGARAFPGGAVVKNWPADAGDEGTNIPHTGGQLSPHVVTETRRSQK